MTIGQVANRAGVNIQTVRFYERKGFIPKAPRSAAGYRQYTEETVKRILFIKHAQQVGYTLREIDDLLSLRVDTEHTLADVQRYAEEKVRGVEERIRKLQQLKDALNRLVVLCDTVRPNSDCSFLKALGE